MKKKRDISEFTPINDQVIVKIIKESNKTKGGLLIPDNAGYVEQGGEADFYKVKIIKCAPGAYEVNPELKDHEYGFVSIFAGHYLLTEKDSYKTVPAFLIVAVADSEFSMDSIKPTANRLLVEEPEEEDTTESGIYVGDLQDPREKEYREGKVIKIGSLNKFEELKENSVAIYDPFVGNVLPRLNTNKKLKTIHDHDVTVIY
jgi:co-chaperonin GroES (HSP10)